MAAAELQEARTPGLDQPFERWVASEYGGWTEGGICQGCRREAPRLTRGIPWKGATDDARRGGGDCEWCLRYHFGGDEAEAQTVRALIGGAVEAALEVEIPDELIRKAVDETIVRVAEREAEASAIGRAGR